MDLHDRRSQRQQHKAGIEMLTLTLAADQQAPNFRAHRRQRRRRGCWMIRAAGAASSLAFRSDTGWAVGHPARVHRDADDDRPAVRAASTTFLGGNRVAAARAVGRDFISARVIKGGLGCRFEGRIKP
jgi:hypothetical protein